MQTHLQNFFKYCRHCPSITVGKKKYFLNYLGTTKKVFVNSLLKALPEILNEQPSQKLQMSWICLLLRRIGWNVLCVTVQGKMQQFLQRSCVRFLMWCHSCLLRKKKKFISLAKILFGNEGLGETGTEWTSSFWLSLFAASNPVQTALFQFHCNIPLCLPTGIMEEDDAHKVSIFLVSNRGGIWRLAGEQKPRKCRQPRQNAALLLHTHFPRPAIEGTGLCLSYCCLESTEKTFQTILRVVR